MTVAIKVVGPTGKDEFRDGLELQKIFERDLPSGAKGKICIATSVQLFGQNPRDVDLVVFGYIEEAGFKVRTNTYQDKESFNQCTVFLNSFCFCIETKAHTPGNIEMQGTNLLVRYGNKLHDATSQSEGQRYSLVNYLRDLAPGINFWVCNFLWMRNLDAHSLKQLTGNRPHNIFPGSFNVNSLVAGACLQSPPRKILPGNQCSFSSMWASGSFDVSIGYQQLYNLFSAPRQAAGALTRKNVERITGREIQVDEDLQEALGNKLIVIAGRAGTGKTVKMLRMGCELASDHGKRCLFLTYNRALVNDIQRTLYFADVPTDFDQACLAVMTIHEFTRKIGIALGLLAQSEYKLENHLSLCREIAECIEEGVITQEDLLGLMKDRHELACWDHVFVDEAQDFHENERLMLFKLYGYQKLTIADGIDQFVRGEGRLDWGRNIFVTKAKEKRSLRQERNLVEFVNSYAREIGLDWRVEPVSELRGGQVIVASEIAPYDLFHDVRDQCYSKGNKAFEMLFLTPPDLVTRKPGGQRKFKLIDQFNEHGFNLWDGTSNDLRVKGSLKIDQHRLLQYDSCRGLEGWCVICLGFDDFVRYKTRYFQADHEEEMSKASLVAMDSEEICQHFVGLWSLVPLTRAIDTIVITLSDVTSPVAQSLRRCANEDYVSFL